MLLSTSDNLPDQTIVETLGLVRGNSVRARAFVHDLRAFFKNFVGGELQEYTKLMAEAREQALDRLTAEARARGANAVVGLRFASSEITGGAAEILVYGTAVRLATAPRT